MLLFLGAGNDVWSGGAAGGRRRQATEGAECSTEEGTARVQTKSIVRVQSKALHKLHIALKIAVLKVQASRV